MAIRLSDLGQGYLVCGKTDIRQGFDSLSYLVKSQFNQSTFRLILKKVPLSAKLIGYMW